MTWLARGRQEFDWDQTAHVLATLINGNPHRKDPRPVKVNELNKFPQRDAPRHRRKVSAQEWEQVMQAFDAAGKAEKKARRSDG